MPPLFTLLSPRTECQTLDCPKEPTDYGFCREHYLDLIASCHKDLAAAGLALPMFTCFDSEQQWLEYEAHSISRSHTPANPCKDCTPDYQEQMVAQGRCAHKEVVFVRPDRTGLEGYSALDGLRAWWSACLGRRGRVVKMPPPAEKERFSKAYWDARRAALADAPRGEA